MSEQNGNDSSFYLVNDMQGSASAFGSLCVRWFESGAHLALCTGILGIF
jgi:hypothetical protein